MRNKSLPVAWVQNVIAATTVARMREARPDMAVAGLPGIGHAPRLVEPLAVSALDRFLAAQP